MSCQACSQRAQHEVAHGPLRARSCSEQCGRALFAGLTAGADGAIHIAAASPLGCAIARKTYRTGDCRLPAPLVATLIGALQRVGPEQSDAPNWAIELPAEMWADILQRVTLPELAAFARASRDAQDLANIRFSSLSKFRRKHTPIQAAKAYAAKRFADDFQPEIVRQAYPKIAEMALAAMVIYDIDGVDLASMTARSEELLREIGADERELYLRPLAVPVEDVEFGYQWKRAPTTVPIMLAALRYWVDTTNSYWMLRPHVPLHRLPLLDIVDGVDTQPMETPESMRFLQCPQYMKRNLETDHTPLELEAKFGVSITHYDAIVSMYYGHLWSVLLDTPNNEIETNPRLHFGYPRTITGQPSNLYLLLRHPPLGRISECIKLMHLKGQFVHCCLEPAFFNVTTRSSLLANMPTEHYSSYYRDFLINVANISRAELAAAGISAPNLFSRYDDNKMLPFHYYIQEGEERARDILRITNKTPIDPMMWRPFAPLRDMTIPFLALQPLNIQEHILSYLGISSTDDQFNSIETMQYADYICRNHASIADVSDSNILYRLRSMISAIVFKVARDTVRKDWYPKKRYYSIIERTTWLHPAQQTELLKELRK